MLDKNGEVYFYLGVRPYKYEDESWREEEWKSPISGLSFRIDDEAFPRDYVRELTTTS